MGPHCPGAGRGWDPFPDIVTVWLAVCSAHSMYQDLGGLLMHVPRCPCEDALTSLFCAMFWGKLRLRDVKGHFQGSGELWKDSTQTWPAFELGHSVSSPFGSLLAVCECAAWPPQHRVDRMGARQGCERCLRGAQLGRWNHCVCSGPDYL